jgi:hypothetical protein
MRFRRQSSRSCCPTYQATPCLYANEEQIVDADDIETVIIAGTLYTSSVTAANCIALELAEADHYQEVCEASQPSADPQELVTNYNTELPITLTGNGFGSLLFTILTPPAHGTINCTEEACIYTPDTDYSGPDSFTFEVSSGSGTSDPATVSITVNPPEVFDADFLVLTYEFVDGEDLDTRTLLTAPLLGDEVGWCQAAFFDGPNGTWYEWAGDNVDQGFESVLIYIDAIREYDANALIQGLAQAWWFDIRESGDVQLVLTAYKGGEMVLVPEDFIWINVGGDEVGNLVYNGNVGLNDSSCVPAAECVTGFTYDIPTETFAWVSC